MSFRKLLGAAIVFSLAAAMARSGATITRTFLVGLGSTETAQIAVVNLAPAPSSGPVASCAGSIGFFSAAGVAIGTATVFTLGTGQAASARLPFPSAGASGPRTLIRGVVTVTRTTGSGLEFLHFRMRIPRLAVYSMWIGSPSSPKGARS